MPDIFGYPLQIFTMVLKMALEGVNINNDENNDDDGDDDDDR